jgi:hypothetical protein
LEEKKNIVVKYKNNKGIRKDLDKKKNIVNEIVRQCLVIVLG